MKTWQVVAIVGACITGMLVVIAFTLLAVDTEKAPTKEQLLISQVHGKYPESTNWADQTIVNIAKDTCAQLDEGNSVGNTIIGIARKYPAGAEADYDLIAFTMVTGIRELCPQHLDKAREFANDR